MKLLVAAILVLAACGSNAPAPAAPKEGGGATAAAALPDLPFDQLDHDQRIAFMKQKVMPVMKPSFQTHDPKAFAEFSCKTCHGDQAKEGHFDMPNPNLPKLNFKDMSKFKKEDIDWMHNEVWPTMGKILNVPLHTEENPKGFGCLNCHTMEGA